MKDYRQNSGRAKAIWLLDVEEVGILEGFPEERAETLEQVDPANVGLADTERVVQELK